VATSGDWNLAIDNMVVCALTVLAALSDTASFVVPSLESRPESQGRSPRASVDIPEPATNDLEIVSADGVVIASCAPRAHP
jgi:hypothetical protein